MRKSKIQKIFAWFGLVMAIGVFIFPKYSPLAKYLLDSWVLILLMSSYLAISAILEIANKGFEWKKYQKLNLFFLVSGSNMFYFFAIFIIGRIYAKVFFIVFVVIIIFYRKYFWSLLDTLFLDYRQYRSNIYDLSVTFLSALAWCGIVYFGGKCAESNSPETIPQFIFSTLPLLLTMILFRIGGKVIDE